MNQTLDPSSHVVRSALIIDDHEADAVWCRRVLERSGRYTHVHHVASAREALALIDDPEAAALTPGFPFEVVFLDINMPGMDGFEFLAALERRAEALTDRSAAPGAILMLSSSDDDRDIVRSRIYDMVDDYIVKPFGTDDAAAVADRYGSPPS